mgnify:CR=1 FL=1
MQHTVGVQADQGEAIGADVVQHQDAAVGHHLDGDRATAAQRGGLQLEPGLTWGRGRRRGASHVRGCAGDEVWGEGCAARRHGEAGLHAESTVEQPDAVTDPVAWFYTPMLLPGIELLGDIRVVYDAMDELTLFRFAPDGLAGREEQLLRRAAVTFAGGASLGEAKATRHPRVRTFPSGVDTNHYRQALDPLLPLPEDLSALPEPRVGYIGVIDERIDYELLHEVAARRPGISWVMVGPVVKVSPDELPVAPNLAYLGQKTYAELPAYVRGFATCMMPFALNDATRFISPTKTLEYMAAHRPIVSTGVTDVVRLYGDVVRVAPDAGTFADQVDGALAESREARDARALLEQSHLARNSWEHIAKGMDSEMHLAFGERQRGHR